MRTCMHDSMYAYNVADGLGASFDRSGDGHDTGLGSPSADECLTDEESTFLPSLVYLDDMDSSSQGNSNHELDPVVSMSAAL